MRVETHNLNGHWRTVGKSAQAFKRMQVLFNILFPMDI